MSNQQATAASLTVMVDGAVVYQNDGSWLHPLFDLEQALEEGAILLEAADIRDKIIGKAAAFLIVRLGSRIAHAHGAVMSRLACGVFEAAGLPYSYDQLVDRIDCKTEEVLRETIDPEEAYAILRVRAGRS